jgi:hypothetical protein
MERYLTGKDFRTMKKRTKIIGMAVLILNLIFTTAAGTPALSAKPTVSELVDPKNVLFISSFSLSYPTVESQIDGIREGLGDDVNIFGSSSTLVGNRNDE